MSNTAVEIVVRCDASPEIGLGHASRALAVAAAVRSRFGGRITFLSAADRLLEGFLGERGIRLEPLRGGGYRPDEVLTLAGADGIVVSDTYDLDDGALAAIAAAERTHVVVDDFAELDFWPCDVVVNPNLGSGEKSYLGAAAVLVGPAYALIRQEVREAAAAPAARDGSRVLVCLGGGAWPESATALLAELAQLSDDGVEVRATTVRPVPTGTIAVPPRDLAAELARCDVGLLSGGVVKYEAAACGLPAVLTAVVPHQEPFVRAFAATGAAVAGPPLALDTVQQLAGSVRELLADPSRRDAIGGTARSLVDGRGAERVAAAIRRSPA